MDQQLANQRREMNAQAVAVREDRVYMTRGSPAQG